MCSNMDKKILLAKEFSQIQKVSFFKEILIIMWQCVISSNALLSKLFFKEENFFD